MGYIDYCIIYDNGEEWSETRPFFDMFELNSMTDLSHCEMLAEQYRAKAVYVVGTRVGMQEVG